MNIAGKINQSVEQEPPQTVSARLLQARHRLRRTTSDVGIVADMLCGASPVNAGTETKEHMPLGFIEAVELAAIEMEACSDAIQHELRRINDRLLAG